MRKPGERAGLKPAEFQLRKAFGDALLELAQANPRVVVLDGDLGNSTGSHTVRQALPERFFNMGIAEANLVSVGAGFSACGYIPFITSFPSFLFCNAFDQIRLSIAIAGLKAVLVGSHAGLSTGREGPSPMSIEDFALAGALPSFTILVPCDPASMRRAVHAAAQHPGPVYIRSSREPLPHVYDNRCSFTIGKANPVREGRDVTIMACGIMVPVSLDAAAILAEEGIAARVLDMHTLRPLDVEAIAAAACETGAIVTAEEHLLQGGMGANIARIVATTHPVPMRTVGIQDRYAGSASPFELMEELGLTPDDVVAAAREAIAAKKELGTHHRKPTISKRRRP
jgi:transketolase